MCVLSKKLLEKLRNITLRLNFSVRMNRILQPKFDNVSSLTVSK